MVNSGQDAMIRFLLEEALLTTLGAVSEESRVSMERVIGKITSYVRAIQTTDEPIPKAMSDDVLRDLQMCMLRYAAAAWARVETVEKAAARRTSYKQVKID